VNVCFHRSINSLIMQLNLNKIKPIERFKPLHGPFLSPNNTNEYGRGATGANQLCKRPTQMGRRFYQITAIKQGHNNERSTQLSTDRQAGSSNWASQSIDVYYAQPMW
jgi:hypothetical protein